MARENQISIYRIDKDSPFFLNCSKNEDFIRLIIDRGNKKIEVKKKKSGKEINQYEQWELKGFDDTDFSIELYHSQRINENSWNAFLSPVVRNNDSIKLMNSNHDFIVFISDDSDIFCFTGGVACNLVDDVCDDEFPLDLMIRLADPEKIKQAKSRGLTGIFYARDLYFRGNQSISATEAFGSVWKDLRASLRAEVISDSDWINLIGESRTGEINCDVKKSFRIRRKVSFKDAVKLIRKIQNELDRDLSEEEEKGFYFINAVKPIRSIYERQELSNLLIQQLFDSINRGETDFDFDFCHPQYENFLDAIKYEVKYRKVALADWNRPPTVSELITGIKSSFNLGSFDEFKEQFSKNFKLITEHEESNFKDTSAPLIDHIHGEIEHCGNNYFLIDKKWYQIKQNFLDILDDDFQQLLSDPVVLIASIQLNPWGSQYANEGAFNESHLSNDGFYVADRICLRGIELFDLLYVTDDDAFIIHVKDGLGSTTRDVCSQLRNSARVIESGLKEGGGGKLEEFEKKLSSTSRQYTQQEAFKTKLSDLVNGGLEKILKEKTRHYVMAIRYGSNSDDILKTKSNIARFEILGLRDEMKKYNVELNILQIKK